jgi:hypothetical protein
MALVALVRTAWFKGWVGEVLVRVLLWCFLEKGKYRTIHDVTLPTEGGTTQVDHVVVSR